MNRWKPAKEKRQDEKTYGTRKTNTINFDEVASSLHFTVINDLSNTVRRGEKSGLTGKTESQYFSLFLFLFALNFP